ncbi:MAG: transketolase [Ignavibacteriales bacterium]|nr:transketolase [Ignavibacteriales bacterium]
MSQNQNPIEELCINTIRFLSVDAVQKANSGHPGLPMGCAPIAYSIFTRHLNFNPVNPNWYNRDRFILSAGHGSMLLYSILHLTGYNLPLEQIKNFRQWGSITPGHPEFHLTPGVETTTGPLGQGFTNSVGMAIAQEYLAALFNKDDIKLLDHYIFVLASDGDMMEGISHEAASLAGHLKLGKLIVLYDNNGISIDGETKLSFSENVGKRFEAYNWHVQQVIDVNDLNELDNAITTAKNEKSKPSIIICNTHIGFGSPNKQDKSSAHGSPLGAEEIKLTKKNLGWQSEKEFFIPDEVKDYFDQFKAKGIGLESEWNSKLELYNKKYPNEAKLFSDLTRLDFGNEWKSKLPVFQDDGKKISTRVASGLVLNAIASSLPTLIGGSADLAPSNNTYLKNYPAFSSENYSGRNFHFGVREHAMAGILNGLATYGFVIPYGATFLVFADYLRPSIRLAAISGIKPILIFTHDSIGLGEDGPTHQPVEQLASLRAIPKLIVIRPADANETSVAWQMAIEHQGSPIALIFSRQDLPVLDQTKYPSATNLLKGAYIVKDCIETPDLILMASGSELHATLASEKLLFADGIKVRVVSFPSWELFEMQSKEYRDTVLPPEVKARVSIEAGIKMGWEKYIGDSGESISLERFGASAPANVLMEKFGFTPDNISIVAKKVLNALKV